MATTRHRFVTKRNKTVGNLYGFDLVNDYNSMIGNIQLHTNYFEVKQRLFHILKPLKDHMEKIKM